MRAAATITDGFFFTAVDPEIALKESRDPLGLQPIWSYFGRQLIGNLTTVTTSIRGFTTLILGHYVASELVRSGKVPASAYIEPFLRVEQAVAYSRVAWAKDTNDDVNIIRGIRRVQARLAAVHGEVRISCDGDGQIWNPESFKLSQVLIMDNGSVCYSHRAQNGFGGMNVGYAVLTASCDFKSDNESGFRALWKRECTNKTGSEETWKVNYTIGKESILGK